jgi:hypothetical protein
MRLLFVGYIVLSGIAPVRSGSRKNKTGGWMICGSAGGSMVSLRGESGSSGMYVSLRSAMPWTYPLISTKGFTHIHG